ncbi:MAG: hypothetical protein ACM3NW_11230 [Syntrophomonadaceae bacterium]
MLLSAVLLSSSPAAAQAGHGVAAGPASGVATRFGTVLPAELARRGRREAAVERAPLREHEIPSLPDRADGAAPSAHLGRNQRDDPARAVVPGERVLSKSAAVLAGFPALGNDGVSPPDPIIAAGPQHVIVAVNSTFGIFTKTGTLLFQFSAASWFQPQLTAVSARGLLVYDPQVAYDHFRGRWVLVYVANDARSQSWILLSVSSSSDPTAAWHSWALPGDTNGTTPAGNFADRPSLGFDDAAITIATNQFRYTDTAFAYAKVRVLDKDPLYGGASTATWSDLWDLEDPATPGAKVNTVRPALTFGHPGVEYLVSNSPFTTRTFVTLWSLSGDQTGTPSLAAADVPVAATLAPPGANQKGGSPGTAGCPTPCLLNTGGGSIASAVFRNGSLWFAHTVADGGGTYSRARYGRIDVATRSVLEDEAFGADGCWYFYPAVAVDAGNDLTMVFGRSCADRYPGVALTARSLADPALEASVSLKEGDGSYVVPIGNGEAVNRWGDFFGAALDPADPGRVWVVGEYAGLLDTWLTWAGETAAPLTAGSCVPDATVLCLGNGRFRVTATWARADGSTGAGGAAPITDATGDFWFFDESNIELVVKVLDGCGLASPRFWTFAGGLTNVGVTLLVEDTVTGASRTYTNAPGTAFPPLEDTQAFPCP